jgi:phage repressor protein C with HTH and peptisase S24 domain
MHAITNNLNILLNESPSMRKMAEAIGVSPTTLNEYIKGRIPPADFIVRVCERLNVNAEWLLTGKGERSGKNKSIPQNPNTVNIPYFKSVSAAAGNGNLIDDDGIPEVLAFSRKWLRDSGISSTDLSIIRVSGDSMFPTLINGDTLLVDHSQTAPLDGLILVVKTEDGLMVKRSGGREGESLTLLSDNPNIAPRTVDVSSADCAILGRVVSVARSV